MAKINKLPSRKELNLLRQQIFGHEDTYLTFKGLDEYGTFCDLLRRNDIPFSRLAFRTIMINGMLLKHLPQSIDELLKEYKTKGIVEDYLAGSTGKRRKLPSREEAKELMKKFTKENLGYIQRKKQEGQKVKLYDPHPGGIYGAIAPLPEEVKKVIDTLDGKVITLREAAKTIESVTNNIGGKVEIEQDFIGLKLEHGPYEHYWCLIKYKII